MLYNADHYPPPASHDTAGLPADVEALEARLAALHRHGCATVEDLATYLALGLERERLAGLGLPIRNPSVAVAVRTARRRSTDMAAKGYALASYLD
jgi:hypothetical protein